MTENTHQHDDSEIAGLWKFQDEANYAAMKDKYKNRKKLCDEMDAKRKAFKDMAPDNPFYHRAAVSAEMAQMRWEMSYIVAENERLRGMIETIDWLHQQVSILQGAYGHVKMLAETAKFEYGNAAKVVQLWIETITKKRGASNETAPRSNETDGTKG